MSFNKAPSALFGDIYDVDTNNRITFQLAGGFGPPNGGFAFRTSVAVDEIYLLSQVDVTRWRAYAPYFTVGNKIKLSSTGTVPVGTTNDTEYWIVSSTVAPHPHADITIKISATKGGAPINTFVVSGTYYTSGITIIIPPSIGQSLPKITVDDADPAIGDWRTVAFALLDEIATKFKALATVDKPTRFTCTKKTTGSDEATVVVYTFSMNLSLPDPAGDTILPE